MTNLVRSNGIATLLAASCVLGSAALATLTGIGLAFWVWPLSKWGVSFPESLVLLKHSPQIANDLALSWCVVAFVASAIYYARFTTRPPSVANLVRSALAAFGLTSTYSAFVGLAVGTSMYRAFPVAGSVSPLWYFGLVGCLLVAVVFVLDIADRRRGGAAPWAY